MKRWKYREHAWSERVRRPICWSPASIDESNRTSTSSPDGGDAPVRRCRPGTHGAPYPTANILNGDLRERSNGQARALLPSWTLNVTVESWSAGTSGQSIISTLERRRIERINMTVPGPWSDSTANQTYGKVVCCDGGLQNAGADFRLMVPFSESHLGLLPEEVLENILNQLDIRSALAAMDTSRDLFLRIPGLYPLDRVSHCLLPAPKRPGLRYSLDWPGREQPQGRFLFGCGFSIRCLTVDVREPGGSESNGFQLSGRPDPEDLDELVSRFPKITSLTSLQLAERIIGPASSWKSLAALQRLSASHWNLPYVSHLGLKHLTLCLPLPFDGEARGTYLRSQYPSSPVSLQIGWEGGFFGKNVSPPGLDDLSALRELTFSGPHRHGTMSSKDTVDFVVVTKPHPSLVFVDIHNVHVNLPWLSFVGDTLRPLVLSGLQSNTLPEAKMTLP
ncbi:uncharacterized protein PV07_12782 [Cladophialophora immunda]|uniref:Uncharacterized protein n=1 Tax=Cladophialophora immunda TaxID=569365 RepID=A0A0D2BTP1_9EURO|nr:uncharacterized protein PV07_12782 [Cladophialophora immunda]KIW21790.1 hypothetical protein PV07_12782 [Cladophialophora immunda]